MFTNFITVMFVVVVVSLVSAIIYDFLPESVKEKVAAWTKDTVKWAAVFSIAVALVISMFVFLPDALGEELPDGFYYKVVFIDEIEDQGKELFVHTDDLNNLWDYWEDSKEIDFNNDEALEELAKYFIEENNLWSEEETETAIIRGRIAVLTMWECCEDDPFDEEIVGIYYTKYVTD